MNFKTLYIFVEGDDDERFFREILLPRLRKKYDGVRIIKYAQKPKKFEYVEKFIKSIQSMRCDYIYVTDINNSPCVTGKKEEICENLRNINSSRIVVIIKEIECWYLAGLDRNSAKKLGIKKVHNTTDTITKESFDNLMPAEKFDSRIDFMREILKNFSFNVALRKNKSFKYFIKKYDC